MLAGSPPCSPQMPSLMSGRADLPRSTASIAFCEKVGLDYVSASPFRVPIARLAAAQAALRSL